LPGGGRAACDGMVNAVLRKVAAAQKPGTRIFESVGGVRGAAGASAMAGGAMGGGVWAGHGAEDLRGGPEGARGRRPVCDESGGDLPQMDDGSRLVAELGCGGHAGGQAGVGLLRGSGRKDADSGAAAGGSGGGCDGCEREADGADGGAMKRYSYAEGVRCGVADATDAKAVEGEFDLILCDVPCSGTGTLAGKSGDSASAEGGGV
jgi:16S rRNA (cytosine967-C5)-methyltransferase